MSKEKGTRTNTSGRLYASYQAKVVDVEHPNGLYLAKVRLLGLWDTLLDEDLPWAEFLLPLGAKEEAGHAIPVEVNDQVWVDFPRFGDTRYPRITGAIYYAPNMKSHLPNEVNGEDGFEQKRAEGEPSPPEYSVKDDIYHRFGLLIHKPHSGGICFTDTNTGSAIELKPDGQIIVHAEAADAFRSSKNLTEQVTTNITIKAGESVSVEAKNANVTTTENVTVDAKKSVTIKATEQVNLEGASFNLKSAGEFAIDAGGTFKVKATNAAFDLG